MLDGEAGIGKTTLFEAAVAEARAEVAPVFSCCPAGAEAGYSFAALGDLLSPVLLEGLERLASRWSRSTICCAISTAWRSRTTRHWRGAAGEGGGGGATAAPAFLVLSVPR